MGQNSENIGGLIDSTGNSWPRRCTSSQKATPSGKMQEASRLSTFSGQVSPEVRRQSWLLPLSRLPCSSAVDCGPKGSAQAGIAIGNSYPLSPQPLCWDPLPGNVLPLRLEAPAFIPRRLPNGSGLPPVGQVSRVPTSQPLGPLSSWHFPSLPQSPMMGLPCIGEGTLLTPSLERTSEIKNKRAQLY